MQLQVEEPATLVLPAGQVVHDVAPALLYVLFPHSGKVCNGDVPSSVGPRLSGILQNSGFRNRNQDLPVHVRLAPEPDCEYPALQVHVDA